MAVLQNYRTFFFFVGLGVGLGFTEIISFTRDDGSGTGEALTSSGSLDIAMGGALTPQAANSKKIKVINNFKVTTPYLKSKR